MSHPHIPDAGSQTATAPAGGSQHPDGRSRYRYVVFSMVVVITCINYIDRGAISYAQADITKEFGFGTAAWGNVLGYFGYGYLVGALVGGSLADRKGPKWVWMGAAALWSVVEMATAFAGHIGAALFGGSALAGFALVRVLFGLAEGPVFSTINRTMANWATVPERGFAASLGLLGTPVGALLTAPIAVGLLSLTHSWRVLFLLLGVLGFIWLVVWSFVFTNLPEDSSRVSTGELAEIRSTEGMVDGERSLATEDQELPWYHFFTSPTLVFNAVGYFAFQYVNFLILTWTPKYLQDEFGFKLSSLWYLGMVPWIGAAVTVLLGGRISDLLRRRTGSLYVARSLFAAISLMLTAICFACIPLVHSAAAALVVMAIGNALNFLPNSVYWTVVIDTAPTRAGAFGGITHAIANIATVLAPALTGYLVAGHGFNAMFVAAGVATGVGMVCMFLVRPGRLGAGRATA